ncbi:response regulator transcription factor [uncultured Pontibacter sp.]|uniref:response regulator transcription factor n=1 Tax=uncultured Pontibacter sp. TaxID=453356 RepID=UPI0026174E8C|nr:response regulator transcription factor [uncultured Pontibacter sp.]
MKILIVEDEQALNSSIVDYLRQEGYTCESAAEYTAARYKIIDFDYACVVVDITLPGGSGLELVRLLKENSPETGIIIISAKDALGDKINGLEIGADDYLTKPFHLSELNARLKSIIRRRNFSGQKVISFGDLEVIPDSADVRVKGKKVVLTKKEHDLLLYFLSNQKRVVTKESIAEHLWGDHIDGLDSLDFVYTHIKNLRRKLMDAGSTDYIQNVYGLGYKFSDA